MDAGTSGRGVVVAEIATVVRRTCLMGLELSGPVANATCSTEGYHGVKCKN